MTLRRMIVYDSNGAEVGRIAYTCSVCSVEAWADVVRVSDGPSWPQSVPVHCPRCFGLIGIYNPPVSFVSKPKAAAGEIDPDRIASEAADIEDESGNR